MEKQDKMIIDGKYVLDNEGTWMCDDNCVQTFTYDYKLTENLILTISAEYHLDDNTFRFTDNYWTIKHPLDALYRNGVKDQIDVYLGKEESKHLSEEGKKQMKEYLANWLNSLDKQDFAVQREKWLEEIRRIAHEKGTLDNSVIGDYTTKIITFRRTAIEGYKDTYLGKLFTRNDNRISVAVIIGGTEVEIIKEEDLSTHMLCNLYHQVKKLQ